MAVAKQNSSTGSAPTRPRLQSVNQDFSDFSEQLRQVAHIIGLPKSWKTIEAGEDLSNALRHLVRARAEWVLRWVLDKLKDEGDAGREARSSPASWQLLDLMIHTLPVSRSAPHLRDASFPTILERVLSDNFGEHAHLQPTPSSHDVHMSDATDSSETIPNTSSPSRKRKRGATATSPSKRASPDATNLAELFFAVKRVTQSVNVLATSEAQDVGAVQAELMKMALRTESAQAARILGLWLVTLRKLWDGAVVEEKRANLLDISQVLHIWELRIVEVSDESASSAEDFSTECLVPALLLVTISHTADIKSAEHGLKTTINKLLARYLLVPARAAFLASTASDAEPSQQLEAFSSHLQPLNAKLLQAAQIEDAKEEVSVELESLYQAVPYLLDLTLQASPTKALKVRLAEKPWIEVVFAALSKSMGCALDSFPEFPPPKSAYQALQTALQILRTHSFSLGPKTLRNIFWFYAERESVEGKIISTHWPLTAALIDLEPTLFTNAIKNKEEARGEDIRDLSEAVFRHISANEVGTGISSISEDRKRGKNIKFTYKLDKEFIAGKIVVPIMNTFARNRNLLGFFRHWEEQLTFFHLLDMGRTPRRQTIWHSELLTASITNVLEQSLTQKQIATIVQEHANRLHDYSKILLRKTSRDTTLKEVADHKTTTKALASLDIVSALLQSLHIDENLSALRGPMRSFLESYTTLTKEKRFTLHSQPALIWNTICQILNKLWPIELHGSPEAQKSLVYPLLDRATEVVTLDVKEKYDPRGTSATQAAAILFLLDACDKLRTLPGSGKKTRVCVKALLDALSTDRLQAGYHSRVLELLGTQYVHLLDLLEPGDAQSALAMIVRLISSLKHSTAKSMICNMAEIVIDQCSTRLQASLISILIDAMSAEHGQESATMVPMALNGMQAHALSREKREVILDRISAISKGASGRDAEDWLSVMICLMDQPNASANISKNGRAIIEIADSLQENTPLPPTALQQLQTLTEKTLAHIVPNREQTQNKLYLADLSEAVKAITNRSKPCSAPRLAVLRAVMLEQKDTQILGAKQYTKLLRQYLKNDDDIASAPVQHVLEAINEIPMLYLQDATFFADCQSWLQVWIKENTDLSAYMSVTSQCPVQIAEYIGRLHTTVARFKLYPDLIWFVKFTLKVLSEPLSDRLKRKAYTTIKDTIATLEVREKLDLARILTDSNSPTNAAARYRILSGLVSTFSDKLASNPEIKQSQLTLLSQFCELLVGSPDDASFNALMDSVDVVLNTKSTHVTQHGIECVLGVLVKLTSGTSPALTTTHAVETYARICETTRLILLVHRSRLGGRLHLLLPLLQNLMFCLFHPNSGRSGTLPNWLRSKSAASMIQLTPQSATQYTRVLSTLCNPPQSSITRSAHQKHANSKSKDLNDPVKASREKTSGFFYPLLASFCRFQLSGRLDADVRKKLMPGLWDVLGAASIKRDALDAMFAGLKGPERDVWRGVWGEWERVHGRREVFVGGEES